MAYSRIEEVIDNYEIMAPSLYPSKQAITDAMVAGARAELAQLRDIAIAAQQERVEGQEGAAGCAALDSRPKAPDGAGNRPSVDMA